MAAAAVVSAALWWPRGTPAPAASPAPPTRLVPLAFRVTADQRGEDVMLGWNPQATAIRTAAKAILLITDGERHEEVALNLPALRTGRLYYRPLAGDLRFRLVLADTSLHETVGEDAIVVGAPRKLPEVAAQAAPGPAAAAPASAPQDRTTLAPAGFVPPAVRKSPSEILPPPVLDAPGPRPELGISLPSRQPEPAPPPEPQPRPEAAPAPAAQRTGRTSEPVLLRRVSPVYPEFALQHRVQGAVRLKILIDTSGHVAQAEVLEGPPVLFNAALEAVRHWVYKPALLDGEPVTFGTQVTVSFRAYGN